MISLSEMIFQSLALRISIVLSQALEETSEITSQEMAVLEPTSLLEVLVVLNLSSSTLVVLASLSSLNLELLLTSRDQ